MPGSYGVREVQPVGWFDGKDTPGSHGGTVPSNDRITGAVLNYGDDGINYNFGELLPGSISGRVIKSLGPDCDFEDPQAFSQDIRIDLLDAAGNVLATTLTNAQGEYEFTGLAPARTRSASISRTRVLRRRRAHRLRGRRQARRRRTVQLLHGHRDHVGPRRGPLRLLRAHRRESLRLGLSRSLERRRLQSAGRRGHRRRDGRALAQWRGDRHHDGDVERRRAASATTNSRILRRARTASARCSRPIGSTARTRTAARAAWPRTTSSARSCSTTATMRSSTTSASCCPARSAAACMPTSTRIATSTIRTCMLAGVRIDLLDASGTVIATTLTDENGEYEFTGLPPGVYQVREHQPTQYFDGGERIGTAGGTKFDVAEQFSIFAGINITSGFNAINYDFCEKPPSSISGRIHADTGPECDFDNPELMLAGVRVDLLDMARQRRGHDAHQRRGRVRIHRPQEGRLPDPRASADRVLRRRRTGRQRGRLVVRHRRTVQHVHEHRAGLRRERDPVRLLREDRRHALGQRLSRPLERRHLQSHDRRRHRRRRGEAARRERRRYGSACDDQRHRLLQVQQPAGRQVLGDGSPSQRLARRHRHARQPRRHRGPGARAT